MRSITTADAGVAAREKVKPVASLPGLPGDFAALERAHLVAGLRELADFTEADDGPLPVVHASYRMPKGPRERKAAYLRRLAARLGVAVTGDGTGTQYARRWFRSVCAEGHLAHPDDTYSGYMARAQAARTARTGSPVAA